MTFSLDQHLLFEIKDNMSVYKSEDNKYINHVYLLGKLRHSQHLKLLRYFQHVNMYVSGCVIPLGITLMKFLIMKTSRKGLFIVEEDLVNSLFAFDMYFLSLS